MDGPMSPRFHLPKLQRKQSRCHKPAEHSWAYVATTIRMAPCDNLITSSNPQNKRTTCCSYLWLQCNSRKGVSILKPESRIESAGSKRCPSGAASLRKRCPKDCCAAIFSSMTVPHRRTVTVSPPPLGKYTWILRGRRQRFGTCLDFSAGDGFLAIAGKSAGQLNLSTPLLIEPIKWTSQLSHRTICQKSSMLVPSAWHQACITLQRMVNLFVSAMEHWNIPISGKAFKHQNAQQNRQYR